MKAHTSLKLATSMSVAALMAFATPVFADTASGSLSGLCGGETCGGSFSITTGNGFVDVSLTSTTVDTHSAGQMLSDIHFTLTNGTLTILDATPTGTGTLVNFVSGVPGGAVPTGGTTGDWNLSGAGGNFNLTAIGGGQPDFMIAGPTTPGYCVPTCQASILNFNPYFQDSADFHLLISGVTDTTDITNISLSFGTAGEFVLVPIPAAVWLFASGLLGLIGIARRRMGVTSSPAAA